MAITFSNNTHILKTNTFFSAGTQYNSPFPKVNSSRPQGTSPLYALHYRRREALLFSTHSAVSACMLETAFP